MSLLGTSDWLAYSFIRSFIIVRYTWQKTPVRSQDNVKNAVSTELEWRIIEAS
jgi:hypothetical protein